MRVSAHYPISTWFVAQFSGFNPVLLTLPADPTGIRCLPLARAPAPRLPENRNHLIDLDCAPRPFQLCPLMRIRRPFR